MLLSRPKLPTSTMSFGEEISEHLLASVAIRDDLYSPGGEIMRPTASTPILAHSAMRNTPLIRAPRISARCHPYELADELGLVASLIVYSATIRERTSLRVSSTSTFGAYLSMWNESATSASEPTAYPTVSS